LNETLQLGEDLNLKYMCKISVFETYISLHVNWVKFCDSQMLLLCLLLLLLLLLMRTLLV